LDQSPDSQPKERPRDRTQPPRSIAVLGGGLTGLTTAWHLTRALPDAKITIYDKKARMGGWIDTAKVTAKTPDGTEGTVYFEHAARMIKPQSAASGPIPKWDDLLFFEMVRCPLPLLVFR
jgi:oxygen-dependent protoporphyrinogen oxidase